MSSCLWERDPCGPAGAWAPGGHRCWEYRWEVLQSVLSVSGTGSVWQLAFSCRKRVVMSGQQGTSAAACRHWGQYGGMSLPAQPSIPSALAMSLFNQLSRLLVFPWPNRNLGSLLMSTLDPTKRKGLPLSFPDSHQTISKPPPDAAPKELTVFPFCTQGGWDVNITTQMCKQCNSLTFYHGSQFAMGPHSHSVARERERENF